MGSDILRAVEQSRLEGKVSGALNATFITLILKYDKPLTFSYFRPISLYNFVYKTIFKIYAVRLKPFLDEAISAHQFGFLHNRQIIELVGITQELLHSIKLKK